MGGQGLLLLIGLKILIIMISHQNIVILGAQDLLILMRSKMFEEVDQAAKHCSFILIFCILVIFIRKLIPSASAEFEHSK